MRCGSNRNGSRICDRRFESQRQASISLELSRQEAEISLRLDGVEQRNALQLQELKEQKIFAGCTYEQSRRLSRMATLAQSVYKVLEPAQRAQRRSRDFRTERRDYQKVLIKYDTKLPLHADLVTWFARFDFWADNHAIPLHARYV